MEVQDIKKVWVAWTNSDLTEGRGWEYPLAVAESMETAIRLGKGGSVQGCNCRVTEENAVKVDGKWLAPAKIENESKADKESREKREAKERALAKAKQLGMTDDDLAELAK
jgi:hypothetical protein